ncbi:Nodulin-21 [Hibiscus syriacus]|uniref:Vacuolar iron transporter n=1 Tax=Hibiscus syriacus TaxID=106335 RepID=A0A6A3CP09_HIBSY|nr:Nodulin-21 [Hibiscus syriacus]
METTNGASSFNNQKLTIPAVNDVERQTDMEPEANDDFDYSKRSQWLRAAVLGANDGLVSTASLMMGVGAVKQDWLNQVDRIQWPLNFVSFYFFFSLPFGFVCHATATMF